MSEKDKIKLLSEINLALDDVRPHLAADGGDVEVVDLTEEMTVKVKWLGSCEQCSMSAMTMRAGIEQTIKSRLPQVVAVEAINGIHV